MPESSEIFGLSDDDSTTASTAAPAVGVPVSVQITLQIGTETKNLNALAATNADPYKIARGLLTGLRDEANGWLHDRES
jgi:hypothetical protein